MTRVYFLSLYARILREQLSACRAVVECRNLRMDVVRIQRLEGKVEMHFDTLTLFVPEPRSSLRLAIGLHEIAHVVNGDFWDGPGRFVGRIDTPSLRAEMEADRKVSTIPNEVRASRYALQVLAQFPMIDPKAAREYLVSCLESYGMEPADAFASLHRA